MNLNPIGGYESHKVVHAQESPRERHFSHRRAIEEHRLEYRQAGRTVAAVVAHLSLWHQRARRRAGPLMRSAPTHRSHGRP